MSEELYKRKIKRQYAEWVRDSDVPHDDLSESEHKALGTVFLAKMVEARRESDEHST